MALSLATSTSTTSTTQTTTTTATTTTMATAMTAATTSDAKLKKYPKVTEALSALQQNKEMETRQLHEQLTILLKEVNTDNWLLVGGLLENAGYNEAALEIYQSLADQDDCPEASYRLGLMLMEGRGVKKDLQQAATYFKRLDSPMANHALDVIQIEAGDGNIEEAVTRLEKVAAEMPQAKNILVSHYQKLSQDKEHTMRAFICFLNGHQNGIDEATYHLGLCWTQPRYRMVNYAVAADYLQQIAKRYPLAAYHLGKLYSTGGHELSQNLELALKYYRVALSSPELPQKLAALANKECPKIQTQLDMTDKNNTCQLPMMLRVMTAYPDLTTMLSEAKVTQQLVDEVNQEINSKFTDPASSADQYYLAMALKLKAHGYHQVAFEIYQYLANEHNHAEAIYQLGLMFRQGCGVELNFQKAFQYFEKAKIPKANYMLGMMYYFGQSVKANHKTACEYLEKAGKFGCAEAYIHLAEIERILAHKGKGGSISQYIRYLEAAAKAGLPEAIFQLGSHYFDGIEVNKKIEVNKNYQKAAGYFERLQNDAKAAYYLVNIYSTGGHGAQPNLELAEKYYRQTIALELGAAQQTLAQNVLAELHSNCAKKIIKLGDTHVSNGQSAQALGKYKEAQTLLRSLGDQVTLRHKEQLELLDAKILMAEGKANTAADSADKNPNDETNGETCSVM